MKKLSRTVNALAQGLLVAAHVAAQTPEVWKETASPWPHVVIGALQGALAVMAHYYNPDGTPARVPWKGKAK